MESCICVFIFVMESAIGWLSMQGLTDCQWYYDRFVFFFGKC